MSWRSRNKSTTRVTERGKPSGSIQEIVAPTQGENDNESRDRALVGDVISTVALAGQTIEDVMSVRRWREKVLNAT